MNWLRTRWRERRPAILARVLYALARAVASTVRLRVVNPPAELDGKIFCGWHGRTLLFANRFRNRGIWSMISHSRDGDMQTRIFRRLGFRTIRGSTGRGGARAAVEAIRAMREGGAMALTPDGPRGPAGVVQPGVMLIAQKSGADLVPVGVSARPRVLARSWDSYMIPLPFSRGVIVFGDAMRIAADADPDEVERVRRRLEAEIHRLHEEAERLLGPRSAQRVL